MGEGALGHQDLGTKKAECHLNVSLAWWGLLLDATKLQTRSFFPALEQSTINTVCGHVTPVLNASSVPSSVGQLCNQYLSWFKEAYMEDTVVRGLQKITTQL